MAEKDEAFVKAAGLLDAAGIVWWPSDGTALGCVREGRFLSSDHDIDLGCWAKDLHAVRNTLRGRGLGKVRRDIPGQVQVRRPGVKFDVHGHTRKAGTVWFPLGDKGQYRYVFPASLFDSFETYEFYGRQIRVPAPADHYLEAHYGPDWGIPKAPWRWDRDPACLVRT